MEYPTDEQIMTFRIDFVSYLREKVEELRREEKEKWGDHCDACNNVPGYNEALTDVLKVLK